MNCIGAPKCCGKSHWRASYTYRASSFASFAIYLHHNLFEESATIGRFCKKLCGLILQRPLLRFSRVYTKTLLAHSPSSSPSRPILQLFTSRSLPPSLPFLPSSFLSPSPLLLPYFRHECPKLRSPDRVPVWVARAPTRSSQTAQTATMGPSERRGPWVA